MAMTDTQLRAKIRELMAAGALPSEPAPIQRPVPPAPTGPKPHMFIGDSLLDQPCTICGELAPQAQLFYAGGIVGARPRGVRCPLAAGARSVGSGYLGQILFGRR